MILKDDPAKRASDVATGNEELWEYLSYMIWYLHSGDTLGLAPESSFIRMTEGTKFKRDRNGTR
jgi:hypothetical protein